MRVFARRYGASPLHLAGHLALFVLAYWALSEALALPQAGNFVLWFIAAIVLHDLVGLPLYSLADRGLQRLSARVPSRLPSPLNHLRAAAVGSGVLLLVFFPPMLGLNEMTFEPAAGYSPSGYGTRWLAFTGALLGACALTYAIRVVRSPAARRRSAR